MNRLLPLLKPTWCKALLFLALAWLLPVPTLRREPLFAFTSDYWVWRYQLRENLLTDLAAGYASSLDILLGILVRDYFTNLIGIPLVVAHGLAAWTVCTSVGRLLRVLGVKRPTSSSRPNRMA